jgi:hypothetical protein
VVEKPTIGRCRRVMELVNDDNLEGVRRHSRDVVRVEGLYWREHMSPALRACARVVLLSEAGVGQDLAVGAKRLLEDLFPVGDEQERRGRLTTLERGVAKTPIIESRDDCLACAGRRYDKIAVPIVDLTFDLDLFEHLGLIRPRAYLEAGEGNCDPIWRFAVACLRECIVETVAVARWLVGLEGWVIPIGIEGGAELVQQTGRGDPREADIPLDAIEQGGSREIWGSYVRRVEAGVPSKEPSLGVEASSEYVVLDLDLGTEVVDESVERRSISRAEIGGGDDAERRIAKSESAELRLEQAEAVPLHKCTDQVDLVRGIDLCA